MLSPAFWLSRAGQATRFPGEGRLVDRGETVQKGAGLCFVGNLSAVYLCNYSCVELPQARNVYRNALFSFLKFCRSGMFSFNNFFGAEVTAALGKVDKIKIRKGKTIEINLQIRYIYCNLWLDWNDVIIVALWEQSIPPDSKRVAHFFKKCAK
jgi:hypothetical protein